MADRRRRRRHSSHSESENSEEGDTPKLKDEVSQKRKDSDCESEGGGEQEEVDLSEYESAEEDQDEDDDDCTEYTESAVGDDGYYDEDDDGWVDEERQSGDGEEQPDNDENKELDDDEDKKNPAYIPRKGAFYEHDLRLDEEGGEEEQRPKKKLWQEGQNKWLHDKYSDDQQAPKSREELIALYGYDIRQSDKPPDAPPRRFSGPRRGRGSRLGDFVNDDSYRKSNYRRERNFRRDNEEGYPEKRRDYDTRERNPDRSPYHNLKNQESNYSDKDYDNESRYQDRNREAGYRMDRGRGRGAPRGFGRGGRGRGTGRPVQDMDRNRQNNDMYRDRGDNERFRKDKFGSRPRTSPNKPNRQWTNTNYRSNERSPQDHNKPDIQAQVKSDNNMRSVNRARDSLNVESRERRMKGVGRTRVQESMAGLEQGVAQLKLQEEVKNRGPGQNSPLIPTQIPEIPDEQRQTKSPTEKDDNVSGPPKVDNTGSRPKRYSSQRQRSMPESNYPEPTPEGPGYHPGFQQQGIHQQSFPQQGIRQPVLPQQGIRQQQVVHPQVVQQHGIMSQQNVRPQVGTSPVRQPAVQQQNVPQGIIQQTPATVVPSQQQVGFAIPGTATQIQSPPRMIPPVVSIAPAQHMMQPPYIPGNVVAYAAPPPHYQMAGHLPMQPGFTPPPVATAPQPAFTQPPVSLPPQPNQQTQITPAEAFSAGGATYYNPDFQQPSPRITSGTGSGSRRGVTYYSPEQQQATSQSKSPQRRPKTAIPIVNPEELKTEKVQKEQENQEKAETEKLEKSEIGGGEKSEFEDEKYEPEAEYMATPKGHPENLNENKRIEESDPNETSDNTEQTITDNKEATETNENSATKSPVEKDAEETKSAIETSV